MVATFSQLINEVIERASLVPGAATQVYAEDRVAQILQDKFDAVFSELWWPDYMQWFSRTLDGTTGKPTQDLRSGAAAIPSIDGVGIATFNDVRAVFPSDSDTRLAATPRGINPNRLVGTTALFVEGIDDDKLIRCWPTTATTVLDIHARQHPGTFTLTSNVFMDRLLLVTGSAWDLIESDATAPGEAQKFQVMFESRLQQLKEMYSQQPVAFTGRRTSTPDQWWER